MIDTALLQVLADKLVGKPTNGVKSTDFPMPVDNWWASLEAALQGDDLREVCKAWAGADPDLIDIACEVFKLTPGAQPPPDPWNIYTLVDAYKLRPPLEYAVVDTIVVPSLNIIYGSPGSFKSMFAADMIACIAGGREWLPSYDPKILTARKTNQAPCLWCDFDTGLRRTHERFEALARARNLPHSAPVYYVSMPMPWLDASMKESIEELIQRAKRLQVKVIAIDNLGTVSGAADENSHEMIRVMSNLRYLSETASVAIIILHHQRKGNGQITRAGEYLRGHGSI